MESFNNGNNALVDEDYELAVKEFTTCIESDFENKAKAHCHRATAYINLKDFCKAAEDLKIAIQLDPNLEVAYYRYGTTLFELRQYKEAKGVLETGLGKCIDDKRKVQYQRVLRKCDTELQDTDILTPPSETASIPNAMSTSITTATATATTSTNATTTNNNIIPRPSTIRYEYYQSLEKLCISVLAKNLQSEDVTVNLTINHIYVEIRINNTKEIILDKQLYAQIEINKSTYEIRKTKIEINLYKIIPQNWPSIEGYASADLPSTLPTHVTSDSSNSSDNHKTVSSSSSSSSVTATSVTASLPKPYATKKDWNRVTSDIEKELESDKPEGEEALQKLFRDIYNKADEDTRRAMNKSFQTSGGTVLSTNWKDVGTKNYEEERQAPNGMEWRSWEGDKIKK